MQYRFTSFIKARLVCAHRSSTSSIPVHFNEIRKYSPTSSQLLGVTLNQCSVMVSFRSKFMYLTVREGVAPSCNGGPGVLPGKNLGNICLKSCIFAQLVLYFSYKAGQCSVMVSLGLNACILQWAETLNSVSVLSCSNTHLFHICPTAGANVS